MKAIKLMFLLLVAVSISACNAQTSQDQKSSVADTGELQVFYFHFTKRCATCNAVENEAKAALEMFYADQLKEGNIAFTSLNLEEEDGKKMAGQLHVTGQTLLLVKGEQMVNLTNEGFMNARTNSGKFHEILKSNIDKML
ncbi:MAG: nitrophenyl compound nitroreductase subunit ArsF family protein [Bacteroidota bacterium]